MKSTTTSALFGAVIACVTLLTVTSLRPHTVQAAVPGGEQYKVVNVGDFKDQQQFEDELNRLGSDGWKVRAGVMGAIILVK